VKLLAEIREFKSLSREVVTEPGINAVKIFPKCM
jgi:hypothetical protein